MCKLALERCDLQHTEIAFNGEVLWEVTFTSINCSSRFRHYIDAAGIALNAEFLNLSEYFIMYNRPLNVNSRS
jgi:hypothetical protein